MSIITKAQKFASLSSTAIAKINPSLYKRANRMLAGLIDGELYAKYSAPVSAVTIDSIDVGSPTYINFGSASRFRRDGIYVKLAGLTDNGLYQLNGRHKITYISDTKISVEVDTTYADAYTSGGTVIEAIMDELEDAEAYLLLYILIPALKEIKEGDHGAIFPTVIQWGEGSVNISDTYEIEKVRKWFYDMAIAAIRKNTGSGMVDDHIIVIGI